MTSTVVSLSDTKWFFLLPAKTKQGIEDGGYQDIDFSSCIGWAFFLSAFFHLRSRCTVIICMFLKGPGIFARQGKKGEGKRAFDSGL